MDSILLWAKALALSGDRGPRPEGQGNSFGCITLCYGLKPLRCREIGDPALKGRVIHLVALPCALARGRKGWK